MQEELTYSSNNLGLQVLRRLYKEEGGNNVFVSPTSIALALSMVLNGASGKTRSEIAGVLGLPEDKLDEVNAGIQELISNLQNRDPQVQIEIANALFAQQGYPFKPEFLDTNVKHFGAEVSTLDFQKDPDGAVKRINGWCDTHTKGKIPRILDQVPSGAVLFLLNAIYFKGAWEKPFEPSQTTSRDFTLQNGSVKKCPTMFTQGRYPYYETPEAQVACLPYGAWTGFEMALILPSPGLSVSDLLAILSNLPRWWERRGAQREGSIYLPKFKIEYGAELTDTLQALGMPSAFTKDADFSNMTPAGAKIDQVKHKTFVEVNEEGTEAAAVTSVVARATSARLPPQPPFVLDINRPFLAAIRDSFTGTLLFLGTIAEPK